jgi:predicted nucleic-acid-binding Zn-ribbon protein
MSRVVLAQEPCPKCGNSWLDVRWGNASYKTCGGFGICQGLPYSKLQRDHLHIRCRECGYEWLTTPLDSGQISE